MSSSLIDGHSRHLPAWHPSRSGNEHHRKRVRLSSTAELVNAQEQAQAGQIAEALVKTELVILDILGWLPFSASGGALLFHLHCHRFESIQQASRGISDWVSVYKNRRFHQALAMLTHAASIQVSGLNSADADGAIQQRQTGPRWQQPHDKPTRLR
ncbi:ATP-binding protein [Pseudooceanicola spongiae]|uniref:IstB-like ATP-binding domain-containing protein n=1 Tax=Pseudooceanicola spongiae TaxID=2613965 RepID=A0A7L9WMP2_9RHOB|nr:hypothetical protein F3W81_13010 [Pseudooceanicola spongiae]